MEICGHFSLLKWGAIFVVCILKYIYISFLQVWQSLVSSRSGPILAANQEEHHHHLHHPQHQGGHLHDHRDVSPIVLYIWNIDVTNNGLFIFNKI